MFYSQVDGVITLKLLTDFAGEEDLIPKTMTNDCIAQSWYRFLKTIGNPVSLTKPEVCHFHRKVTTIILSEYMF